MKYQPDARYIRYGESPKEIHETHVRTCLHFLLVNLLNRAPWSSLDKNPPQNRFRDLFSHLHKATHLQFLAEGIVKILRQPVSHYVRLGISTNTDVIAVGSQHQCVADRPEATYLGSRDHTFALGSHVLQQIFPRIRL